MRKNIKEMATGRAWLGRWNAPDGELGWMGARHLVSGKRNTARPNDIPKWVDPEERFYLAEIIIRPIKDKRGHYITRKAGTLRGDPVED